jgi:type I restriction enzyme, R subunit
MSLEDVKRLISKIAIKPPNQPLDMHNSPNFLFLKVHHPELVETASLAERYFAGDPSTCLFKLRQFAELLAQLTAAKNGYFIGEESQSQLLRRLKDNFVIKGLIKEHFYSLKDIGNEAVHSRMGNHRTALSHLKYAHTLAVWFHQTYGDRNFVAPDFVPPPASSAVPTSIQTLIAELSEKARVNRREAESAQVILAEERRLRVEAEAQAEAFKQKLAQVQAQAETLPDTEKKELIQQAQVVAQSAKLDEQEIRLLIDQQLRDRGWEADTQTLRYSKGTRPEVGKNRAIAEWPLGPERVDYALFVGINLLGVLEAKAEDAVKAQTQTEAYVKEAAAQYNVQPFAFFSDHYTTYFWEKGKSAKRLVSGLFSPEDLQRLAHIRIHGTSLAATQINTKIAGRVYQQEAIRRICEAFESGKRRALLVMATGTGKTRTAMALIELFLQTNQAQKVLFVADRDALVQQALDEGFKQHLPHEPRDRIITKNIDSTKRLYVVTQQTLDKCYHQFSPAFFDLIIFDEAHRSLFNKFKEVVDYFDARMIGLTATPANFVDRNTFLLFQCDDNLATYLYDYDQAVDDKVLVDFSLYRAQTHFQRQGIHGVDLTDEQREALIQQGIDPDDVDFSGTELEKEVSNKDTLRKQWEEIMEVCFKDESGQLPAKTIIFALTQDHALRLCRTFEEMYPQYSDLARVITHKTESKGRLTKQFKDETSPRIAISVDMLDTGVNVPEAMNLVFMKPVRSRIKLWQMIGRGTRNQEACKHLEWLPNRTKAEFKIIDFWENDFDREAKDSEVQDLPILVRLFNTRLKLMELLLTDQASELAQQTIQDLRSQVALIPTDAFSVRKQWQQVSVAWTDGFWRRLNGKDLKFLKQDVGPLLRFAPPVDVAALTFIHKMERLKLQQLRGEVSEELVSTIADDVGRLPDFVHQDPRYEAVRNLCLSGRIAQATVAEFTQVVELLADQMRNKRRNRSSLLEMDLADLMAVQEYVLLNDGKEQVYVTEYKERVESKILEVIDSHPAIAAIEGNGVITDELLIDLERTLRHELGGDPLELSTDNIRKAYKLTVTSFLEFVRTILDLEDLPNYEVLVQRAFESFITRHQFNGDQIRFLRAVQSVFLQKRRLQVADLYEGTMARFGQGAVDKLFTDEEVHELMAFAKEIAA